MKIEISIPKTMVQGWSNAAAGRQPGYTSFNKVGCIKAVRNLSGLGLKEAKDLIEAAMGGDSQELEIRQSSHGSVESKETEESIRALREHGCTVNDISGTNHRALILGTIREVAIFASNVDEYSLAAQLNELLAGATNND